MKALFLLLGSIAQAQTPAFSVVNAASYAVNAPLAPGAIVSGFSPLIVPPVEILVAGSPVVPLGAVAGQVNFVLPAALANGDAVIQLRRNNQTVAQTTVRIGNVAPGLFDAGLVLRVNPDGSRSTTNLSDPFDPVGQTYLVLFGTGIRGTRTEVSATLGGIPVGVLAAGPQSEFAGLDQVNLGPVPEALTNREGIQPLRLTVDGIAANSLTLRPSTPGFNGWARRAELSLANSEMSVAEWNGKIYVMGGYPASRVTSNQVQVYDTAVDVWTLGPPLPAAVNHTMPAVANGKVYLIGGQSDAGNSSFVASNFEYDPETRQWRSRAPLPRPRGGGAAAALNGKIYVAGGRPPGGAEFAVYDPATDRWTELPNLPTQRNHLAVVAANNRIYVIGGRTQAGFQSPVLDDVEIFDPAANTWSKGAPLPRPRGGLNAVEANGCIHTFGGEGNTLAPNGVFPDHDVYNPVTNTWTHLADLPVPIHGVTGLAFRAGLIYLPGGGTAQGGSSGGTQHQVYRPEQVCR
ncbi:MAG: hypothetical protein FJW30_02480 [Acidobacteria bacterium]|nr:hypothetical protein [Acidobacteriota bacterium]